MSDKEDAEKLLLGCAVEAMKVIRETIGYNIPHQYLYVFWYIVLNEGCTANDIQRDMEMSQSAVARAMKELSIYIKDGQEKGFGLIYQTQDPYHRKRYDNYLTPKGKELYGDSVKCFDRFTDCFAEFMLCVRNNQGPP
jgi:DNA-binding MarR family transcriptional regulator